MNAMTTTPTRPRQPPVLHGRLAVEPGLAEVLADPIVRTLMARDGVGIGDIRYLVSLMRNRCRRAAPSPRPDADPATPVARLS